MPWDLAEARVPTVLSQLSFSGGAIQAPSGGQWSYLIM